MRSGRNERNCLYFPFFPPITSIHSHVDVCTCLMNRNLPDSPWMESSVFFSMIRPLCLMASEITQSLCGLSCSITCFFRRAMSVLSFIGLLYTMCQIKIFVRIIQ